jgi:Ca2+-binding EF-hand superfamily protein
MRTLSALPALLLAVGLVTAADGPKDRPSSTRDKQADRANRPLFHFDVDAFLKEHDKNKDGFLTREELPERFRHNFDKIDTNKDGKLSREELRKGAIYLEPRRRPSDVVFVLVEMSDCDECCAEELQLIYDFLRKLDTNKDGTIQVGELKEAREALVRARVDRLFKALDTNKDGKISRDEAKGQIKKNFDQLDTNRDGFIDRDELTAAAREKPQKTSAREGDRSKERPDRPRKD